MARVGGERVGWRGVAAWQRSRSEGRQRGELGLGGMVRWYERCLFIVVVVMGEVDVGDVVEVMN